jgi:hypothetical protein
MADIMPDPTLNQTNLKDTKERDEAASALLYIREMQFGINVCRAVLLLLLILAISACAARSMNKKMAHDLIVALPEGVFNKDDISIHSVSQTGANHAIAVAGVRVAFKLERIQGNWVIQEVRLGNGEWVKLDSLLRALDQVKSADTQKLLEQVAAAAEKYRTKNGTLPEFTDYISLSNSLNPDYMTSLIREDAWRRPLAAYRLGPKALRLVSAGPDGKLGSSDDIELRRTFD